jgi:hypothetical protein
MLKTYTRPGLYDWYNYVPFPMAAVVTTTWNPSDKSANITLTNGNLTASTPQSAVYAGVRSVASASSGKKYWETLANVRTTPAETGGAGNASATLSNFNGQDAFGMGWFGSGEVYTNLTLQGTIQTWVQGDTLCFALDIDNSKMWFRTNGGNWNNDVIGNQNPATNTGGFTFAFAAPVFAMLALNTSGDQHTANFGATAYAQTPPAGFGNW